MRPYRDLTDEEWERVVPLLPELRPRKEARGRPLVNTRAVLNGVLWIMFSGASWAALPRKYPSYQTCHRRFKVWYDTGVLKLLTRELLGPAGDALFDAMSERMRAAKPHVAPGPGEHSAATGAPPPVAPALAPAAASIAPSLPTAAPRRCADGEAARASGTALTLRAPYAEETAS